MSSRPSSGAGANWPYRQRPNRSSGGVSVFWKVAAIIQFVIIATVAAVIAFDRDDAIEIIEELPEVKIEWPFGGSDDAMAGSALPELRGTAIVMLAQTAVAGTVEPSRRDGSPTPDELSRTPTRESPLFLTPANDATATAIARRRGLSRGLTATAASFERKSFLDQTSTAVAFDLQRATARTATVVAREHERSRASTATAVVNERRRSRDATSTATVRERRRSRDQTATAIALLPTSTPTPTPGPSGLTPGELSEARQLMLRLINEARRQNGLVEVVLDDNPTAQLHADDSKRNCFLSHWGSDGWKPYMRFTQNGGVDYSAENVSGANFCPTSTASYRRSTLTQEVQDAHDGLMRSPGHRRNVLNPNHRKVGIGIAVSHPNAWVVQLFASDFVEFPETPDIRDGTLSFAYRLRNGATQPRNPPRAFVHFDQAPDRLTRGQLTRSECYGSGERIAGIRSHPPGGSHWTTHSFSVQLSSCRDPNRIATTAPAPTSYFDPLATEPYLVSRETRVSATAPWIDAEVESLFGGGFRVTQDISELLDTHGSGVYSIIVFAIVNGVSAPVSNYSIFVD